MPDASPLVTGDPARIGEFRIAGRLGAGGQGVVYLAYGPGDEPVALKVLQTQVDKGGKAQARFAREVAAASRVAPFCTARVIAADVFGATPYIVSEYVEGPSLREKVETDGPLSGADLDRLAVSTATALAAIHDAGIVHRDFKPGNVLLAADGPRVIDFGIARLLDATTTITSQVVGTPAFMSPEQFTDGPIGPASDMFAWGCTIGYAASGRSPFGAASIPATMHRILNEEPQLEGLEGPLRDIVAAALSKRPEDRPTPRAVLDAMAKGPSGALLPPPLRDGAASGPAAGAAVPAPGAPPDGASADEGVAAAPSAPRLSAPAPPASPPPPPSSQPQAPPSATTADLSPPSRTRRIPAARRRWPLYAAAAALAVVLVIAGVLVLVDGTDEGRDDPVADPITRFRRDGVTLGVVQRPPYLSVNGDRIVGFEADVVQSALSGLGITRIRPVRLSFPDLEAGVTGGQLAITAGGLVISPARCRTIAFSDPVYVSAPAFLVRNGNPAGLSDLRSSSVRGARLGVVRGSLFASVVRQSGADPEEFPDVNAAMNALRSGAIDGFLDDVVDLRWSVRSETTGFEVTEPFFSHPALVHPVGFAFPRGADVLRRAVNHQLARMRKDGRLSGILRPYGFTDSELDTSEAPTAERACAAGG